MQIASRLSEFVLCKSAFQIAKGYDYIKEGTLLPRLSPLGAHLNGNFLAATAAWIILTKQVLQTAWCAHGNVCMVARFVAQATH